MLKRRRFSALCALGATALLAPALVRAQIRLDRSKLTIAVNGKASFFNLPLLLAEQLGFFKDEGLDAEIVDVPGLPRMVQMLQSGQADVMCGAYEHIIYLQSQKQRTPQAAFGVSNKTLPGFQNVLQLRGKKIGVTAPGSSTNLLAARVLARAGIAPQEVSFVGVGNAAGAIASLRMGQIDAICNTEPIITQLEDRSEIKIIGDGRSLRGTQELYGGLFPSACLSASQEFVQKNPATCQAAAQAVVRALQWLQTAGLSDMNKMIPESYMQGDRALYLASFAKLRESMTLDGQFSPESARTALQALVQFDPALAIARVDLAKTYTNEFTRRAKEKYKI
jgi:NitT/TauT family transport system substrate-binding protein